MKYLLMILNNYLFQCYRWISQTYTSVRKVVGKLFPYLLTTVVSLALAFSIRLFSANRVLIVAISLIVAILVVRRLVFGIGLMFLLVASVIPMTSMPKPFVIGGQGPYMTEFLLVIMIAVVFIKACAGRKHFQSYLTVPVLLIFASAVLAIVVSCITTWHSASWLSSFGAAYNSVRPFIYYAFFFVIAFGINSERELRQILSTIMVIAVIVSIISIVQSVFGIILFQKYFGNSFMLALDSNNAGGDNAVIRSLPPGLSIITLCFCFSILGAAYKVAKNSIFQLVISLVLGMGIVFSFYRGIWIAMCLSMFIAFLVVNVKVKVRLTVITLLMLLLIVIGIISVPKMISGAKSQYFSQAVGNRFGSMFQKDAVGDASLQYRFAENRSAIRRITKYPIFGIGAGTPINYTSQYNSVTRKSYIAPIYFMHNSYLEMWLVYGILGIMSFIAASVIFLVRSWLLFLRLKDPLYKSIVLALFVFYIGLLQRAVTQMHFTHDYYYILTTAFIWGIIELIWRLYNLNEIDVGPEKIASVI